MIKLRNALPVVMLVITFIFNASLVYGDLCEGKFGAGSWGTSFPEGNIIEKKVMINGATYTLKYQAWIRGKCWESGSSCTWAIQPAVQVWIQGPGRSGEWCSFLTRGNNLEQMKDFTKVGSYKKLPCGKNCSRMGGEWSYWRDQMITLALKAHDGYQGSEPWYQDKIRHDLQYGTTSQDSAPYGTPFGGNADIYFYP